MLTIFATPKAFRGHDGIIQRNALGSWARLHPDCQVILFGDEPGAAETARELGIQHISAVRRTSFGSKRLDDIFHRAQEMAVHDRLCYVNCDIIFLQSFHQAVRRVVNWSPTFLMVGRRCDAPVTQPVDFEDAGWEASLRKLAARAGKQQLGNAVDYFVFPRGLYAQVPPFAVGRIYWDHWLVWKARSMGVPVVDASADVLAIHQDHDFGYHAGGLQGLREDPESKRNRELAGGQLHLYTIDHATHELVDGHVRYKRSRWHAPVSTLLHIYTGQLWYWTLKVSFAARHALGLHRGALAQVQRRLRSMIGE